MGMYALNCLEKDYDELVDKMKKLGVIDTDKSGNVYEKNGGCWDYIGAFDVEGVKYIYINCATKIDIDIEPQKQDVVDFEKFLSIDINTGKSKWPDEPLRVFL
jgi:hypothetical protein